MLRVQKIDPIYTQEDCMQLMIPYQEYCRITDLDNKVKFCVGFGKDNYRNDYMEDERRKNFPYNNIPIHKEGNFLYANQILEYDTVYKIERTYDYDEYAYIDPYEDILFNSLNSGCNYTYMRVVKSKEGAVLMEADYLDSSFNMSAEELLYQAKKTKDPKISRFKNKGISKQDIKEAKKLVKELHRKRK